MLILCCLDHTLDHKSRSHFLEQVLRSAVCEGSYTPVALVVVIFGFWDAISGHQVSCSRKQPLW